MKIKIYFLVFALLSAFICGPVTQTQAQTEDTEITTGTEVTEQPAEEPAEEPVEEPDTPKPEPEPVTPDPEPEKTPTLMKAVSGVKLTRYSTNAVKVTWKKHSKAKVYRVYRSTTKNGKAKLAGTTTKTRFLAKKLKNNTTYYFYVVAYTSKKPAATESKPSKKVSIKTKTYSRKTIFAGDSICQGVGYYNTLSKMHIGGKKQVVAYKGLNTTTFHTKRIFNGQTGLQKIISEKPYRVYMMLGMNEIHYASQSKMITEYEDMIRTIQKESPDTDIVLCAVSPVTRTEQNRRTGFKRIPAFNQKLKKLAAKTNTTYFDYTGFLKDSSGCLKTAYSAGDGFHWKSSAYAEFAKSVEKFDKSLDQ